MSQILTRTRRERRPPLAPDQAVRPLTDRGPASARRPPGRISIVIDSDSDYSDESTPRMEEETNALSSSSSVAAIPEVPRPFPLGGVSLLERTPDHGELIYPPQTNEAFQALLGVANDMGFHYKAPENGEETEEQTAQSESDEEESLPTWRQETPPPTTTAPAELRTDAMLLVNVRLKQGFHKHAVLRTLLPQSALGAYECFVTSAEVGVSNLLKTPLSNARQLSPRAYGQMTDFVGLLARLEERYGLAKKEKKKGNTGRTGGSSRWNERGGIKPDALEEDID
ncbi:hypothetical protein JOM56_009726 [Amanita muscaria]